MSGNAMTAAFRIHAADNVATLLGDAEDGVEVRGEGGGTLVLLEPVALGHKVALADIGTPVNGSISTISRAALTSAPAGSM